MEIINNINMNIRLNTSDPNYEENRTIIEFGELLREMGINPGAILKQKGTNKKIVAKANVGYNHRFGCFVIKSTDFIITDRNFNVIVDIIKPAPNKVKPPIVETWGSWARPQGDVEAPLNTAPDKHVDDNGTTKQRKLPLYSNEPGSVGQRRIQKVAEILSKKPKKHTKFKNTLFEQLSALPGKQVTQSDFDEEKEEGHWICVEKGKYSVCITFDENYKIDDIGVFKSVTKVVDEKKLM